jgi:putative endonuclease
MQIQLMATKKKKSSIASSPASQWWLYLLACKDGRTYAGIAIDVQARFKLHVAGKASKFTRANPPRSILGAQAFPNRSEASKAEYALKQLDKRDKLSWAKQHAPPST